MFGFFSDLGALIYALFVKNHSKLPLIFNKKNAGDPLRKNTVLQKNI